MIDGVHRINKIRLVRDRTKSEHNLLEGLPASIKNNEIINKGINTDSKCSHLKLLQNEFCEIMNGNT